MEALNVRVRNLERMCDTLGTSVEELLTGTETQAKVIRSLKTQIVDLEKTVAELKTGSLQTAQANQGSEQSLKSIRTKQGDMQEEINSLRQIQLELKQQAADAFVLLEQTKEDIKPVIENECLKILERLKEDSPPSEPHSSSSSGHSKSESNTTHVWYPPNYTVLQQEELADPFIWQQSPPFYLGDSGYKLRLEVALTGNGTAMAIALYLVRGKYDSNLCWPMRNEIQLSVVDHSEEENHKRMLISPELDDTCKIQPWCRPRGSVNPCMFLTESFLEIEMVESRFGLKYLLDKSLHFEVELMEKLEGPYPDLPDPWLPVMNNLMISAQGDNILLTNTSSNGIDPRCFTLPILLNRHQNYFEVRIIHLPENNKEASVAVGVCPVGDLGKSTMPGWKPNSSGFHSDDGQLFLGKGQGEPFGPISGITDILGSGLKLDSFPSLDASYGKQNDAMVEVFFTRNNVRIGDSFEMRYPDEGLVPAVGLNFLNVVAEMYEPSYRHFEDFVTMPRK